MHRSSTWLRRKDNNKRSKAPTKADNERAARAQLPPGILNSANDCFANTVLQSLIATPLLEDMILFRARVGEHIPGDPTLSPALTNGRSAAGTHELEFNAGLKLSDTFLAFMENAYRARGNASARPLNPRDIIKALGLKFDQYLDFRQQDAHELLRHLLDAMYMDEMDIAKKRQPPLDPKVLRRKARRQSERPRTPAVASPAASVTNVSVPGAGAGSEEPRLEPFASTIFGGRLASIIVCDACKNISHTYEDFMDLSLPIKAEDLKKKSTFRAIAERFTSSLAAQQTPSAVPSRPSTPVPPAEPSTRPGSPAPPPLTSNNSTLTANGDTSDTGGGYVSQLGRSVSTRLGKSRERMAGRSSRPSSVDPTNPRPRPKHVRPSKPTPGEAAYLRALLRDDPGPPNPLAVLRGAAGGGAASTASTSNSSGSNLWGRIGSNTINLVDCLRMFTSVEILEGDNSFACHNCWKMMNPDAPRSRKSKRRGRARSPGSSSEDDDGDTSSSSSSDERSDVEVVLPPKANGLLRPELGANRTMSADARLGTPDADAGETSLVVPSPSPDATRGRPLSLHSTPGPSSSPLIAPPATAVSKDNGAPPINITTITTATRPVPSHPIPDVKSHLTPVPFPSFDIPSISTSLPSPETPSPNAHQHPLYSVVPVSPEGGGGGSGPGSPTSESDVPRFRRFSSFHAEKFLSPNISRESLASAPPDEGLHAMLRRKLLGSSASGSGSGSGGSTSADAGETEAEESGGEGEAEGEVMSTTTGTVPDSAITSQTDLSLTAPVELKRDAGLGRVESEEHLEPPSTISTLGPLIAAPPLKGPRDRSRETGVGVVTSVATAPTSSSLPTATITRPAPVTSNSATENATLGKDLAPAPPPSTHTPVKRADQVILRHAFKRYLIDDPPPVLVIHLKRFQQIHRSGAATSLFAGSAKKLEDYVSFPEVLDVRPFLAPRKEKYGLDERGRTPRAKDGGATGGLAARDRLGRSRTAVKDPRHNHRHHHHWSWNENDAEDEEPPVMYRLYSVVMHIGSMLGGHYIAYTALPEPPAEAHVDEKVETTKETEKEIIASASDASSISPSKSSTLAPTSSLPSVHSLPTLLGGDALAARTAPSPSLKSSKPTSASIPESTHHQHHHHHHRTTSELKPRQWCYVSDTTVRLASLEEALKSKAYLLFYERLPVPAP